MVHRSQGESTDLKMLNNGKSRGETWSFLSGFVSASAIAIIVSFGYTYNFRISGFWERWKQFSSSVKNHDSTSHAEYEDNEEDITMDSPTLSNRILRKAETVIQGRTSRVLIVVERCTNDHNYSAILRTAEALGIQHVWVIAPPSSIRNTHIVQEEHSSQVNSSVGYSIKRSTECDIKQRQQHHLFARRAVEWLTLREFDTTEQCLQALVDDGRTIWVTDLSQSADCLTWEGLMAHDGNTGCRTKNGILPERLAIVFGTEAVGCTQTMLHAAHRRVHLPMRGFADSLNLSVAAALCILQLFHLCPEMVGQMPEEEKDQLRREWFPKLASQRILTTGMRKQRARMTYELQRIEELEQKLASGEKLEIGQQIKLQGASELRRQLQQLEDETLQKAHVAVYRWIENPPRPLSDMRRADMHRVCYVGVNTKKKYKDIWKGMPAVSNVPGVQQGTAKEFRESIHTNSSDKI
jgi:tRNA G18 (ribose-2'-O)-methylase SpoU